MRGIRVVRNFFQKLLLNKRSFEPGRKFEISTFNSVSKRGQLRTTKRYNHCNLTIRSGIGQNSQFIV